MNNDLNTVSFLSSYYGAASAGASPTLFYSMPPPGLGALGGGSMGAPNISAAGFTSALAAAAAAAGAGASQATITTGAPATLMASHHALSAAHPLSQSHLVNIFLPTHWFSCLIPDGLLLHL